MFRGLTWEAYRASTTATAKTNNENQPTRQKKKEKRRTPVDDCCFVGLHGRPVRHRPLPPPKPTTRINQHDKRKKKKDERQWMIVVSWAYVGGLSGLDHFHRQNRQRESTNTTKEKRKKTNASGLLLTCGLTWEACRASTTATADTVDDNQPTRKTETEKRRTTVDDCCFVGLCGRPVGPQPLPPPIPTTTINQHDKRKKKKDERQWMIVVSWAYVGGLSGLDHCHRRYRR